MRPLVVALVVGSLALTAPAGAIASGAAPESRETSPLIAVGGSTLTNGVFMPGAAVYQDGEYVGVPYEVPKGNDIMFTTPDGSVTLGNGHQIRSVKVKKKTGRPLFQSEFIANGESTLMITSHLKRGTYAYRCTIHFGQYGLLKIVKE